MHIITIFLTIAVAIAATAPTTSEELAKLRALPALDFKEVQDNKGQYNLHYRTAEGIIVTESGKLIPNPNGEGSVMVFEGEVIYPGDDGKLYVTKYTAGLDGYKPVGAHLPVEPVVPSETPVVFVEAPFQPEPPVVLV